jgi:hypothetical protein
VVEQFHRAGVPSIYCGFIVGGPNETVETMETTLGFAKHLLREVAPGSFECHASFLTPLPGTDIRARPEQYGVRLLDPDLLTSSNFNFCTTATQSLDQQTINNFRWRFIEEIDREIRALIPAMSWKQIEKHALMFERFNIATAYMERFRHHPRLAEYLRLVGESKFERSEDLSDAEVLERFPTRLAAPLHMAGDLTTIGRGPGALTLNGIGSRIYALCSGKLTVAEIARHLATSVDGAPGDEQLRGEVVQFVRELDRSYAIFLKDF